MMFANRPALGDFKENVMSVAPGKILPRNSQKGLKGRNLNSFSDSNNLISMKKPSSGLKGKSCSSLPQDKENSKPKFKEPAVKAVYHAEENSWPEIEKMHLCIEPEDEYEDILPKHERIQKKDLDSLFYYDFTIENFTELIVDKPPSPLKECENLDIEVYAPAFPDIKASLYDDTELEYIPLPDDFLNY